MALVKFILYCFSFQCQYVGSWVGYLDGTNEAPRLSEWSLSLTDGRYSGYTCMATAIVIDIAIISMISVPYWGRKTGSEPLDYPAHV